MKININKLTYEEKIRLVIGKDFWSISDLGGKIKPFTVSDGPVGLRQPQEKMTSDQISSTIPSIAYPSMQISANTWNKSLLHSLGRAIGNDCIDQDVDIVLGPGVNIKRLPLCGRNFEYFSEDPIVAGKLAYEYICGVQEKNVGTCLKHFCCNNSEYSRHWASMEVDERTLHEIYLKPFEIAAKAKPWTAMCSYNLVNGIRMSENTFLYDVLRNDFGFDGLIISDWCAVKDSINSINAHLNLEMPYLEEHLDKLLSSENTGKIDMEALDDSVSRIIDLANRCEQSHAERVIDMTKDDRRQVALHLAEEGIVLLKNEDAVLPLQKGKVMVTGVPAVKYYYGGGSSAVVPEKKISTLEEALKNENIDAKYVESIYDVTGKQAHIGNAGEAIKYACTSDYTIVCVGDPTSREAEDSDREDIKLPREEEIMIHELRKVSKKLIVLVYAGAAVDMRGFIDEVDAVLFVGYPGEYGSEAVAKILKGSVNPSGKLTETFPLALEDVKAFCSPVEGNLMVYEEGLNVGYRFFDTYNKEVLFPFGYGLSYSKFEYSNLKIEINDKEVEVYFDLENNSDVDGQEIAQIYVSDLTKKVYRPFKELKEFIKVKLEAHEKKTIKIILTEEAFSYYNVFMRKWTINSGLFKIQIGANVQDIRLSKIIEK